MTSFTNIGRGHTSSQLYLLAGIPMLHNSMQSLESRDKLLIKKQELLSAKELSEKKLSDLEKDINNLAKLITENENIIKEFYNVEHPKNNDLAAINILITENRNQSMQLICSTAQLISQLAQIGTAAFNDVNLGHSSLNLTDNLNTEKNLLKSYRSLNIRKQEVNEEYLMLSTKKQESDKFFSSDERRIKALKLKGDNFTSKKNMMIQEAAKLKQKIKNTERQIHRNNLLIQIDDKHSNFISNPNTENYNTICNNNSEPERIQKRKPSPIIQPQSKYPKTWQHSLEDNINADSLFKLELKAPINMTEDNNALLDKNNSNHISLSKLEVKADNVATENNDALLNQDNSNSSSLSKFEVKADNMMVENNNPLLDDENTLSFADPTNFYQYNLTPPCNRSYSSFFKFPPLSGSSNNPLQVSSFTEILVDDEAEQSSHQYQTHCNY